MSKLALNQQLWNAIEANNLEMVEATLVAGADPDFRDTGDATEDRHQSGYARSVLHEALLLGRPEAASILLRHGAEQACDGLYALTPLHLAALFGHEDLVDQMISHGADVSLCDGTGGNALMNALMGEDPYDNPGMPIDIKYKDPGLSLRIAKRLIEAGADINAVNEAGEAPLWNAARYQTGAVMAELIALGANPHHHTIFDTSLVTECADALNRADALGQMSWRADECRAERQRALDVLKVLHDNGVELTDTSDEAKSDLHYSSPKIQREVESWWQQWDKTATAPVTAARTPRR